MTHHWIQRWPSFGEIISLSRCCKIVPQRHEFQVWRIWIWTGSSWIIWLWMSIPIIIPFIGPYSHPYKNQLNFGVFTIQKFFLAFDPWIHIGSRSLRVGRWGNSPLGRYLHHTATFASINTTKTTNGSNASETPTYGQNPWKNPWKNPTFWNYVWIFLWFFPWFFSDSKDSKVV